MEWTPINSLDDLPTEDGLYLFRFANGRYALREYSTTDPAYPDWYLQNFVKYIQIPPDE